MTRLMLMICLRYHLVLVVYFHLLFVVMGFVSKDTLELEDFCPILLNGHFIPLSSMISIDNMTKILTDMEALSTIRSCCSDKSASDPCLISTPGMLVPLLLTNYDQR